MNVLSHRIPLSKHQCITIDYRSLALKPWKAAPGAASGPSRFWPHPVAPRRGARRHAVVELKMVSRMNIRHIRVEEVRRIKCK